jgi:hypothetical protein
VVVAAAAAAMVIRQAPDEHNTGMIRTGMEILADLEWVIYDHGRKIVAIGSTSAG